MRAVSSRSACTSRRRLFRTALVVDRAVGAAAVAGCGKLYRARSRLYRSQILQENMRLKALAEIYTMHSFAQLCNPIFFQFIFSIHSFEVMRGLLRPLQGRFDPTPEGRPGATVESVWIQHHDGISDSCDGGVLH